MRRLDPAWTHRVSSAGLWLFFAVALLSIAAQNVLFVGLAAWALGAWGRGRVPRPAPALLCLLPFLAWSLLAGGLSEHWTHSFDTWRRWALAVAAWYAGDAVEEGAQLRSLARVFLACGALCCLGSVLWSFRGPVHALASGGSPAAVLMRWPGEGDWRAHAGSGGYMVLGTGSMLALCFGLGLAVEDAEFRRPLPLACLGALGLGLLFTFTRSAWLGASAGCGLILLRRRPLLAGAAALVLAVFVLAVAPVRHRLGQGLDMGQDSTSERVYMAEAGLGIIRDHPWFGVGDAMASWDGHLGYYRRYMPRAARLNPRLAGNERGHLHDDFIQVAAMYGVPALVFLLAFFGILAAALKRLERSGDALLRGVGLGLLGCVLAWWCNGLFEYNFGSMQSCFTFWALLGLGLAALRMEP